MLISDVILEVISDVGADSDDSVLVTKMLGFAKGALRRFPLFTKSRLLYITSTATLTAGANSIPTPTYFISEKLIWYVESGSRKEIIKKDDDKFLELVNTSASGVPEYYHIANNLIEFDKNSDVDRTIYIEHLSEVDNVTAASSFFGSTDMLEILKDGMKATYYNDYVEDPIKGDKKLALFKAGLDELEKRHMIQTMGGHIGD